MNPCKCGWYKHYKCPRCGYVSLGTDFRCNKHKSRMQPKCICTTATIESYKKKLSGPLLDRIDLKVMVSSFDKDTVNYLRNAYKLYNIGSNRVQVKLLLVSRTIADLEATKNIKKKHIDLAVKLMGVDDDYFKYF